MGEASDPLARGARRRFPTCAGNKPENNVTDQRSTLVHSPAPARWLLVLSGVATLVALVVLARLTLFMADDARPRFSAFPSSGWELRHSCVSAYFVAAGAARDDRSVYSDDLYTAPNDDGKGLRK